MSHCQTQLKAQIAPNTGFATCCCQTRLLRASKVSECSPQVSDTSDTPTEPPTAYHVFSLALTREAHRSSFFRPPVQHGVVELLGCRVSPRPQGSSEAGPAVHGPTFRHRDPHGNAAVPCQLQSAPVPLLARFTTSTVPRTVGRPLRLSDLSRLWRQSPSKVEGSPPLGRRPDTLLSGGSMLGLRGTGLTAPRSWQLRCIDRRRRVYDGSLLTIPY
ncbi:hypothetical protein L227DRAFT_372228 [Lentinus tigrinus ALCF2SS1-6]|uniref:Uncharacterized protein n=1 Tax=Lentinus tigrinus ALCF2SS1-6 TaxID=1328759 RepID=A0A5C2RQX9_9APHY|nr:hypothetical protein L227DRAFT_372228 [Lentinus tigrinus ALCF2SS1-6]